MPDNQMARQGTRTVFARPGVLAAPDGLPAPAVALWDRIMASTPDQQWRPGDVPLLSTYCRTAALAAEAAHRLEVDGQVDAAGKPSVWARLLNQHSIALAALAAKLRLCPSSRIRAEAAGLQKTPAGRAPWETDDHQDR